LIRLALMPIDDHVNDGGPGSVVYRVQPLIWGPKGALTVALDGVR
jgi:hypothetical protein